MAISVQLETTQANGVARRQPGEVRFGSLPTSGALRIEETQVSLGDLTEGESFMIVDLLRVRNIYKKPLHLSVELVDMPGFSAQFLSDVVAPKEEAVLQLEGTPLTTEPIAGRIVVRGLGQYLELSIPVTAEVLPKPQEEEAPAPAPVEEAPAPAPVEEAPAPEEEAPAPEEEAPAPEEEAPALTDD